MIHEAVRAAIAALPDAPGVYLFKNKATTVVYIGKAKSLKKRVKSYVARYDLGLKEQLILDESVVVEHILTKNELAALLLEAELIQSYQPRFNVLLKTGQPYCYYLFTTERLPRFLLVRTKTAGKGTLVGPFLERSTARHAYEYLKKTFRLSLCSHSIERGCLAYHLGICAGNCRPDFDEAAYRSRLTKVKRALQGEKEPVVRELDAEIRLSNEALTFEYSAELVRYKQALAHIFDARAATAERPQSLQRRADKDIWLSLESAKSGLAYLVLYRQREGVLTLRYLFALTDEPSEYIESYYRTALPAGQVILAEAYVDPVLLSAFCTEWHKLGGEVSVAVHTDGGPHGDVLASVRILASEHLAKKEGNGRALKILLQLPIVPHSIDCFDISHKQGHAMVGSAVRFVDGAPAPASFRHFLIRTLTEQNDYAALQEVVVRRYREGDLPDLIVIDGGKGQLHAAEAVLAPLLVGTKTTIVSLAKREETIFGSHLPADGIVLDPQSSVGQLLIALRDHTHHFAITYHRKRFQADTFGENAQ